MSAKGHNNGGHSGHHGEPLFKKLNNSPTNDPVSFAIVSIVLFFFTLGVIWGVRDKLTHKSPWPVTPAVVVEEVQVVTTPSITNRAEALEPLPPLEPLSSR